MPGSSFTKFPFIFTFLEGFASFISPCILPLLPVYISYFAGKNERKLAKSIINSIGFVLGFSIVFVLLGVFASTLGNYLSRKFQYTQIIFGLLIILIGLNYLEIINISFLNKSIGIKNKNENIGFIKSFIFGILFSVSYTPCVGMFLSSALLLVASGKNYIQGILLMIFFSLGLGLPFIISTILIEKLKNIFKIIKNNYKRVKLISGLILIIMGIYLIYRVYF